MTESIFLSHNSADKEFIRGVAVAIAVTGAKAWFDEWAIRPGDSIPGRVEEGLSGFSTFAIAWSAAAAESRWVQTEMDAAVTRWIADEDLRVVPIRLDATALPSILASVRYIDAQGKPAVAVARELLGIDDTRDFRLAVQTFISSAGLEFREFWGAGVYVACPRCGAPSSELEGFHAVDYARDDEYAGARCTQCGWDEGSEI